MMFSVMFIGCLCSLVNAQFNLYQTDRSNPLGFDCLHFYLGDDQFMGPQFLFPTYQKISYCRRPLQSEDVVQDLPNVVRQLTFEELDQLNVTTDQLLSWSASTDQTERYAAYRSGSHANSSVGLEKFRNCSSLWFGPNCQYSFLMGTNITLADVVQTTFYAKTLPDLTTVALTNLTCYELLKCCRAKPFCLDWREICNGRMDCENGEDEEQCWQLEMNECGPDEFRCHNGICIPADFFSDDPNNPDCLDRTDERVKSNDFDTCFQDPTFRCEEHICHPRLKSFSCGDGDCVSVNGVCRNGRHELLKNALTLRDNLSEQCWTVMICLTNINRRKPVGSPKCSQQFDTSEKIRRHLNDCAEIFPFPVHSLIDNHVRFLFFKNRTDGDAKKIMFPDLICYNQQLCDTIQPSYVDGNLGCITRKTFDKSNSVNYIDLIFYAEKYFRTCSSMQYLLKYEGKTLYHCKNSSKRISKSRLGDRLQDCPLNDDEEYNDTCSLRNRWRLKCNERDDKCYAPIVDCQVLRSSQKTNYTEIFFHQFCDGQDHSLRQIIDGYNHTDETHCVDWPCNNLYTRCDIHPDCPNREDEWNCVESDCPVGFHLCVSPINYTSICLPSQRFHDNQPDCLGVSDEPKLCHKNDSPSNIRLLYRCWGHVNCISSDIICTSQQKCTSSVDKNFCQTRSNICSPSLNSAYDTNEPICRIFNQKPKRKLFFSSENITPIPSQATQKETQKFITQNGTAKDIHWPWRCNRGLYVRFQYQGTNGTYRCFCPPSYYGEFCQYQSQRISLTLEILTVNRRSTYSFVVRLIDNNSETVTYEQFSMMGVWGCDRSFNMYLLYPDRPKDPHNNYSLHIDAFDQSTLTYWTSWFVPIPFQFLPVNRLAIQLNVLGKSILSTEKCYVDRSEGVMCCQYDNHPKTFCQTRSNCTGCPSHSLCVGMVNRQPICVCPIHKVGPRCMLDASCPSDRCSNHGECILFGHSSTGNDYICACDEEYYGTRCEGMKTSVQIALEHIETSTFIVAHHVNIYAEDEPKTTIHIKKLYRDQSAVIFSFIDPVHLIFIQIDDHYYFTQTKSISNSNGTLLHGKLAFCPHINTLIHHDLLVLPPIRLIKQYHVFCANFSHLSCFIDDYYTCLCTSERHANCFRLKPYSNSTCQRKDYCENDGICLQDAPLCPTQTVCLCQHCYFGPRCQFYAKGFGLTLDDILRYEFQRHSSLAHQKISVKISAILTSLMFVLGSISSLFSFLTFRRQSVQKVGCGLYLFTISLTSFFTVLFLNIKFWFLVASQLNLIHNEKLLRSGCITIEPLLKIIFSVDSWLKACVAIERSMTISRGIHFNKANSKRIAQWVILILPIVITLTLTHEFVHREVIQDTEGFHQHWCITNYPSSALKNYNAAMLIGHFSVPFLVNLCSTIFIIVSLARQQLLLRQKYRYRTYLRQQFSEHKQTLISPIILVLLSSPRLIISLMSSCIDSSHDPRWYLTAYFISFIPSVLTFVVFVLPSNFYQAEFRKHFRNFSDNS